MVQVAGLTDSRQQGPPADIGTFQFCATAMVFKFTFSGITYTCAMAAGASGWSLIAYSPEGADDVEIQAAITYCVNIGGGHVHILSGRYSITATIILYGAISLRGDSIADYTTAPYRGTILVLEDGSNCDMIAFGLIAGSDHDYFSRIEHIYLEGNKVGQGALSRGIVILNGVEHSDSYINHVMVHGFRDEGISLADGYYHRIVNCWFEDNDGYDILLANTGQCWVSRCISYSGIKITVDSDSTCIVNNYIANTFEHGIYVTEAQDLFIKGNRIVGTTGHGIFLENAGAIRIYANNIEQIGKENGTYAAIDGIRIETASGARIIGNKILSVGRYGIYSQVQDNGIISNNYIGDCSKNTGSQSVYVYGSHRLIITNNHIRGENCIYNIRVVDTNDALVIDNIYQETGTSGIIEILGSSINNIRLSTVKGEFPASNIGGGAVAVAPVINTSPGGVDIDANDEFCHTKISLPTKVQQIVRIKIWAYSNVIEATNNMLLRIVAHGAGSSELWNGNAIDVVDVPSVEEGAIIQYDVIHWVIDATDDAQIGTLAAQDLVELMAIGEAASAPDIATDGLFGGYEIEYV